jgi:SAM-dependent methyltransferase
VSRRNHGVPYFVKHADQIVDIIRFLGRNPYDLKVLDFAFGWGHWCRLVKGFGCKVYGTESSTQRTEAGRASGIIILDPAEITSHRFDWINANQVFEHLPEPLETLRHLRSALNTGGIVTLGVPGANDLKAKIARGEWKAIFDPLAPLEHLNFFPRGCLARMAATAGLGPAAVPERFIWRPETASLKQNVKAVLRLTGAPVSNHLFHVFRQFAA